MTGRRATLCRVALTVLAALRMPQTRAGDLGLAAVAAAAAVGGTVVEILGASRAVPPLPLGVVLALLAGVLVLWRRTPLPVAVAITILCLLYHLLGYPGLAPAVVLFVALYALTARGDGFRSSAVAIVLIVAVSAVPLLPPEPVAFGWSIAGPAVGLVAVAAFGDAARARQAAVDQQLEAVRRVAEQDARQLAMEERIEVAREVHDVLAHTITVISVQAAAAAEALDDRPEDTRVALAAVRSAAREAIIELRGTLALLRTGPPAVDSPAPGLGQLRPLRDLAEATGLAVSMTVTGQEAVSPEVERVVYRIVQEALTNTIRHAAATTTAVTVDVTGDEVVVEIIDNGVGGSGQPPEADGHGLAGMNERVRALGGTLRTGPLPGSGFRVAARLPAAAPR